MLLSTDFLDSQKVLFYNTIRSKRMSGGDTIALEKTKFFEEVKLHCPCSEERVSNEEMSLCGLFRTLPFEICPSFAYVIFEIFKIFSEFLSFSGQLPQTPLKFIFEP